MRRFLRWLLCGCPRKPQEGYFKPHLTCFERRQVLYALSLALASAKREGDMSRYMILMGSYEIIEHLFPME